MGRKEGDRYEVLPEERRRFETDGYVHLEGVVSETELRGIEAIYQRFLVRDIEVPGKDFCDMSGEYDRPLDDFAIVNVMLPRKYYAPLQGNVFERRAASIAGQLCGADLAIDYDQFIAKRPLKTEAVFHWHQDLGYWPVTPDTRTASFWLALDDSTLENGCMRFVPGTHLEKELRGHEAAAGDRDKSHTLVARVDENCDEIRPVPIRRGDVTVHHERVLHGSGGNNTDGWRRAYILAFRAQAT
ncbi:MAG: phytanoyl-CoA hydroxylase, partial [Planctomycetota bacterium]